MASGLRARAEKPRTRSSAPRVCAPLGGFRAEAEAGVLYERVFLKQLAGVIYFYTGAPCVAQAGFQLGNFLSQSPQCWDSRVGCLFLIPELLVLLFLPAPRDNPRTWVSVFCILSLR